MASTVAVETMRAAQVTAPGAALRIVELKIPNPGPAQVRIQVRACGVCRSDAIIVEGRRPGIPYPRVPGHEVAGVVDALGAGVTDWWIGQRVGVGWHGGHDGTCPECRRGDFRNCRNEKNPGISYDGGYQEYMRQPGKELSRRTAKAGRRKSHSCHSARFQGDAGIDWRFGAERQAAADWRKLRCYADVATSTGQRRKIH